MRQHYVMVLKDDLVCRPLPPKQWCCKPGA